jgi:NTP pyrophosphatase (non-canonical NTP hydrolase)
MSKSSYHSTFVAAKEALLQRGMKHGFQSYASNAEFRGVLDEEIDELREAIRSNDHARIEAEAMDCAVVLLHFLATSRGMK